MGVLELMDVGVSVMELGSYACLFLENLLPLPQTKSKDASLINRYGAYIYDE